DVNVNGGSEKTKYKFTLVNQDQPGVLVGTGLKQTNLNLTINTKLSDKFTLEYRTRMTNRIINGSGTESVSLLRALREAPTGGLEDYMTLPENNSFFDPEDYEVRPRFNP